jgi:hypothetical protein
MYYQDSLFSFSWRSENTVMCYDLASLWSKDGFTLPFKTGDYPKIIEFEPDFNAIVNKYKAENVQHILYNEVGQDQIKSHKGSLLERVTHQRSMKIQFGKRSPKLWII